MKTLLTDRRGDGYLSTLIKLSVILSLTACFIAVIPIFSVKQSVDYMAQSLTRTIELTGERGPVYEQELERLKAQTRLDPAITITGIFTGTRIQLREPFTLTLTVTQRIKLVRRRTAKIEHVIFSRRVAALIHFLFIHVVASLLWE